MRVSSGRFVSASARRGQALLEFALAVPVVLLLTLGAVQLTLLAHARLRLEAALDAAARAFVAYGSAASARTAAALSLAPASPRWSAASSSVAAAVAKWPGLSAQARNINAFVYAFAHTHVQACAATSSDDAAPLIVSRGDPVRLTVTFDAALLVPLAGRLLADGNDPDRSDSAQAALAASPLAALARPRFAEVLDRSFAGWPKRRLLGRTAVLWGQARTEPAELPLCVG